MTEDIGHWSLVIGDLIVKASYIGYETRCVNLTTATDTLLIRLREETEQLAEVVILQKAPLVERRMDKIVMNVASSPFAIGNNGKDILKKAPGVHIDRKGKITVNGKAVEVYLDGRASYLSGEQLKAMLEGTDGSTIDRLEIITQPSSKYDAAGQGGIINIKTKRNRTKGLNGSVSSSYGGMYWCNLKQYMQDDHVSFNLNYRSAKTYTALSLNQQFSDRTEAYQAQTDTISASSSPSSFQFSPFNFRYTEHIAALYATVGKQFGEHWATKLGLRGEYTLTNGKWLSADSVSRKSYFNLFPMAFVSYMPTPDWSIALDYTRRIERPHYTMLDPSAQYEDGHSLRMGNTELKPSFIHELMLSFGYSEYVTLDFAFGYQHDLMDYQVTVLPDGNRVSQAVNYGNSVFHGIFLSLTEIPLVPKFTARDEQGKRRVNGAWLTLTAQGGAGHEITKSYDGMMNMRQWMVDVSAELNAYLPKDWTISIDGMYTTPSVWGMERMSAWTEMNLAVKKDFPKLGLTLTARVNDLMLSSKWHSESLGLPDGYTNTFAGYDRMHSVSLGLSYKFGTSFDHRKHADLDDSRLSESTRKNTESDENQPKVLHIFVCICGIFSVPLRRKL